MARGEGGTALVAVRMDTVGVGDVGSVAVDDVLHAVGDNKGGGDGGTHVEGILEELAVVGNPRGYGHGYGYADGKVGLRIGYGTEDAARGTVVPAVDTVQGVDVPVLRSQRGG